MLPQGVFSVAVATVLFPSLSRLAARRDMVGFRRTVSLGLRQIAFLLVPAGVVSAVLAEPIVRLLYQRGAFTHRRRPRSPACLAAFCLGLTFNGAMLMLNRAFFSLQENWIPTVVALGNLFLNAMLDVAFASLGMWGIPLSTAFVNIAGTAALLVVLRRRLGRLGCARSSSSFVRVLVAGVLAGAVAYWVWKRARLGVRPLAGRPVARSAAGVSAAVVRLLAAAARAAGARDAGATLLARPLPQRLSAHGPAAHPQLLDHRAHRPRQVDARRPHSPAHGDRLRARDARPAARLDGPRARARDHDQGAGRPRRVEGPRAQPDRHARATSTSPTRSRARCRPARARCSSSTPRRGSRRRRSRTPIWRSRTTSRSSRS